MDDINCPICKISNTSVPINSITEIKSNQENFLIKSQFLKDYSSKIDESKNLIDIKSNLIQPNIINPLPNPNLLNQVPPIQNKTLQEQLKRQDLENIDVHGITKRIPIKKGELEFK